MEAHQQKYPLEGAHFLRERGTAMSKGTHWATFEPVVNPRRCLVDSAAIFGWRFRVVGGSATLEEVVFHGESRGCGARAGADLCVDGAHMPVYGTRAYEELFGYPGVGHAPCH